MSATSKQRPKTRDLIRWDNDKDLKLLLGVWGICNRDKIPVPWDKVGRLIGPSVTGNAVLQHLVKLRNRLQDVNPEAVPDIENPPSRKPKTKGAKAKEWSAGITWDTPEPRHKTQDVSKSSSTSDVYLDPDSGDPDDDYGAPRARTSRRDSKSKRKFVMPEDSEEESLDDSPTKKTKLGGKKPAAIKNNTTKTNETKARHYAGKRVPEEFAEDSSDDEIGDYVAVGSSLLPKSNPGPKTKDGPSDTDDESESDTTIVYRAEPSNKKPSKLVKLKLSSDSLFALLKRKGEASNMNQLNTSALQTEGSFHAGDSSMYGTPVTPHRNIQNPQQVNYAVSPFDNLAFSDGRNSFQSQSVPHGLPNHHMVLPTGSAGPEQMYGLGMPGMQQAIYPSSQNFGYPYMPQYASANQDFVFHDHSGADVIVNSPTFRKSSGLPHNARYGQHTGHSAQLSHGSEQTAAAEPSMFDDRSEFDTPAAYPDQFDLSNPMTPEDKLVSPTVAKDADDFFMLPTDANTGLDLFSDDFNGLDEHEY